MGDFKPGDVVRLKSGGPSMTLLWQYTSQTPSRQPEWSCAWHTPASGKIRYATLPEMTFEKVPNERARLYVPSVRIKTEEGA